MAGQRLLAEGFAYLLLFHKALRDAVVGRFPDQRGTVPIYPPLLAVQQIFQQMLVEHVGRCHRRAVRQPGAAVHPDGTASSKSTTAGPCGSDAPPGPSLVHVLGRTRRRDDRGVHDRARSHPQPARFQLPVHLQKQLGAQLPRLQHPSAVLLESAILIRGYRQRLLLHHVSQHQAYVRILALDAAFSAFP